MRAVGYALTVVSFTLMSSAGAQIQINDIAPKEALARNNQLPDGWHPTLKVGANLSFGSNSNVIGQAEGDTTTMGGTVEGQLIYKGGPQEWRQKLNLAEATTKAPTLPRPLKSKDELKYETIYLRGLESFPRIGPFARASIETQLFVGHDVRETALPYAVRKPDGSIRNVTTDTLKLTDAFAPLTTRESVGFFYKIAEHTDFKAEVRLGLGAMQVAAKGQLALRDDPKTAVIEVAELTNLDQVGAEAGITFSGTVDEVTSYSFGLDLLTPFAPNLRAGDNRTDLEMTNIDGKFDVTSRIYSWAHISYELRVRKQPQLLDDFQIQHFLLLNFSYSIF